jgi:hypothetical protein
MSYWDMKELWDHIKDRFCKMELGMMVARIHHKEEMRKERMGKKAPTLSRAREQVERMLISRFAVAVAIHHG